VSDRLTSVSYSTAPVTSQTYLYENASFPFALTGIIDENGNRFASWTYDSSGRATSSQHANGVDFTTIGYNDVDGSRMVTNVLGDVVKYRFAKLQGVPKVTEIDRFATASVPAAVRTFTYDTNGYVATSTDWNTNMTAMVNDFHGQPLVVTEAVGTAQARTITNSYLAQFRLPAQIIAPGKTLSFGYDAGGNPLTVTETDTGTGSVPYSSGGRTRTWSSTFDNLGHVLTATGPRTDVTATTAFAYDASNNLGSVTNALDHVTRFTSYNGSGLPLVMINPNGVTLPHFPTTYVTGFYHPPCLVLPAMPPINLVTAMRGSLLPSLCRTAHF
jgi:YD repeat-containing protein